MEGLRHEFRILHFIPCYADYYDHITGGQNTQKLSVEYTTLYYRNNESFSPAEGIISNMGRGE